MGFIKEFKEFAMKGNVMDMAVGVIIGGAFGKIVSSLVNDILMPLVGKVMGNVDFTNLYIALSGQESGLPLDKAKEAGAVFAYGQFCQNVIDFIIVAFCIFVMLKAINKLNRKKEEPAAPEAPKGPTQEELLEQLEQLEPFGTGNPKPLFADRRLRVVGTELSPSGKLLKVNLRDENGNYLQVKTFSAEMMLSDIKMWSECDDCGKIINYPMLDIIYRIDVNEYNGREYLDCWVEHYRRRHAEES